MENPIKMDDLGGTPIFGNIHMQLFTQIFKVTHRRWSPNSRPSRPVASRWRWSWALSVLVLSLRGQAVWRATMLGQMDGSGRKGTCTYLNPPKTNMMAPKNDGFQ